MTTSQMSVPTRSPVETVAGPHSGPTRLTRAIMLPSDERVTAIRHDDQCIVCYEKSATCVVPCYHAICADCYLRALPTRTCPMCRQTVTMYTTIADVLRMCARFDQGLGSVQSDLST